uniref:Membrane-associated ring finger (C3HC4) 5, like n=1 Tax=Callorhinchus milii TaxID=7868 RepID=A0A4W3GMZ0_CALMI
MRGLLLLLLHTYPTQPRSAHCVPCSQPSLPLPHTPTPPPHPHPLLSRADPLFLLMGLPTIPVVLILAKMIRWEDFLLRLWRKYSSKLQALSSIFPGIGCPVPRVPTETSYQSDHMSVSRILCGSLVFPTIASIVGRLMFGRISSSLQRTILGGITFVAIKGALKVYFKQQQYLIQANRRILNYPERETEQEESSLALEEEGSE